LIVGLRIEYLLGDHDHLDRDLRHDHVHLRDLLRDHVHLLDLHHDHDRVHEPLN
jgi:hypothetical protein